MAKSTKRLVLVAGNIGAGKTSLTQMIGEQLGWQMGFEEVDNPYLGRFYQDMAAWAFHLQVFHLGHRSRQMIAAAQAPESYILDRSLYEDFHIFTRALRQIGDLNAEDYATYESVYDLVVEQLPKPDLLLYLKAPVPALLERIQQRGRSIETGITADYLNLLDGFYEEWIASYDLSPVLTIPSGAWDYVNKPAHIQIVVQKIQEKLAGKEHVLFPDS
ncbi:MAG: deoxynucleoside kinase [Chloroflexi bacterium]|nr:deoxynucleoside kinase [Chloroflexota bacterium]MQC26532.1 deoxynucleoside kinase [Chloroflexota bacterium]